MELKEFVKLSRRQREHCLTSVTLGQREDDAAAKGSLCGLHQEGRISKCPGVEGNGGGAVDVPLAPSRTPEEKDRRIWMGLGPEDSMWELTQRDSFGVAPGKS